jgi:CheY-like chemotaxis protein
MTKNQLLNLHILVVEDNEFNQFLAETYLKRNGAWVSKAMDGKEALDKIQTTHFDLILMDIQMPVMDGKEATRIMRKLGINTPVIGCSAHALESEKDECISLGMNGYLTKPFEEEELINIIVRLQQKPANDINTGIESQNPGFDNVQEILEKVKAEVGPDFVAIVVNKFSEDLPVLISDLKTHMNENDLHSIQSKTHKLTGTLATFKFPEGLRLARLADIASKNQKAEETAEAVSKLIVYLEKTLEQLKKF